MFASEVGISAVAVGTFETVQPLLEHALAGRCERHLEKNVTMYSPFNKARKGF